MSWDDWVFGALTGGAYNVGKAVYEASDALDQAGNAAEQAGGALAGITSTVTKLGKDLSSFIKELEELLTIKRLTPRSEEDLWDEEVERLQALRQREAALLVQLEDLGKEDDDQSWFESFWDSIFGGASYEELAIRTKLAVVRSAIHEILYEEPGVIPNSIHNIQLILERFNTLEQPRLERILDGLDDNLEQSEDLLKEVKKLFVVRTWRRVQVSNLKPAVQDQLSFLESSLSQYEDLITKNTSVAQQLQGALVSAQPTGMAMQPMTGISFDSGENTDKGNPQKDNPIHRASMPDSNKPGGSAGTFRMSMPSGPSFALKGKVSTIAAQPMAASIATTLNQNVVASFQNNLQTVKGRIDFYRREKLKLEKQIHNIVWIPEDEPGVIPVTLEEIRKMIARFHSEAQPRMEVILDSVNSAVLEATNVLTRFQASLAKIQEGLDFLSRHSSILKIGLAVTGGLIVLILLMSLIVLFRAAFGF